MARVQMGVVAAVAIAATVMAMVGLTTAQVDPSTAQFDPVNNYYVEVFPWSNQENFHCKDQAACPGDRFCPRECPTRSIEGPGDQACFMNCIGCSIGCRHRKPLCNGYGAICYDPRFIGGDGVMFYFHGQKDHDFCVVSDKSIHVNAHFIGKRPEGRPRDYTWVQGLGILFGAHQLGVSARKVATWSNDVDQLTFSFDGQEVSIPAVKGALWTSPSGIVVIERTSSTNGVQVFIDQLMELLLEVVPITEEDSRVHNYQITKDDCFAHLQMQFNFFHLSGDVDGVLGQTYRPDFKTPVKVGVPMPIMGGEQEFHTSSLFSSDCKATQFTGAAGVSQILNTNALRSFPVHCNNANGGMTCRR